MATTPEGKVKARLKKALKDRDIYYTMPFTAGYGASGVPDVLICHKGRFIGIECKANGNKPTALQGAHIQKINESGGIARVVDENNIDETIKELFDDK
jgi:hypothetical protein